MSKNVLDTSPSKARSFFLEPSSYTTIDIPQYFTFGDTVKDVAKNLGPNVLSKKELNNAKKSYDVNYSIVTNKDGRYAWRKLDILNPLIYVSLVNLITDIKSWNIIKKRLEKLRSNKSIKCLSYPVVPKNKSSQKAAQICEWVNQIEKESIRLAIDFEFVYQTDISNCYGAIYTHSIAWALHGKKFSKKHRGTDDCIGNYIDNHIQAMSNGQTNGIPQGSLLMDFVAEIVLTYSDSLLSKKLRNLVSRNNYQILRYRDDYKIFVKNQKDADTIIKALSEILGKLGLQLNASKTIISSELIISSIKPDKIFAMDIKVGEMVSKYQLRNDLILIYRLGNLYPNCGAVKTLLTRLFKIYENKTNTFYKSQEIELVSILTNIGRQSPTSFPIVAAFISLVIKNLEALKKTKVLKSVSNKLGVLPNYGLLEVWIQRIAIPNGIIIGYNEKICRKISDSIVSLFNMKWSSNSGIRTLVEQSLCFDQQKLDSVDSVITSKEVDLFKDYYDGSR